MYTHMILATERIKEWHQQAAQERLVREARRARRARTQAAAGQAPPHSRPAPLVTSRRGVAEGRPAAADERRPESTRVA